MINGIDEAWEMLSECATQFERGAITRDHVFEVLEQAGGRSWNSLFSRVINLLYASDATSQEIAQELRRAAENLLHAGR